MTEPFNTRAEAEQACTIELHLASEALARALAAATAADYGAMLTIELQELSGDLQSFIQRYEL